MLNTKDLSEAKRALLAKYMRGDLLKPATHTDSITRRTWEGPAPLSFGQQQLWLLAQLMPDTPVYTECVTIHLPGPLNRAILEQSYNEILRRHEAWRTSFPLVDGQPVQRVHLATSISLPLVDLRYLPEAEREAEALRLMAEDAQRPFDIANGPLQRATLVCLDDKQHKLFLTLHHIIFDCFSLYQILLPELRSLYEAFLKGEPSPLPELPIQHSDFAAWQRERMQGAMLAEQLHYWKKQLAGAPALLALPTDHPRPATPSYKGAIQQMTLSESLTGALREISRKEGVTLYTTLLASFNTLLYRYTGQDDILIRADSAGRNRAEFQHMLGVFINMLVLRTAITDDLSFSDLLQREQRNVLEMQTYQDVPFEYLVHELLAERKVQQNPLFQVALTLEPPAVAHPSGWSLTHMAASAGTPTFDLSLIIEHRPESLICHFQYNTDLFDAVTIVQMAGYWQALLESIVRGPSQTVGQLLLLTPTSFMIQDDPPLTSTGKADRRALPTPDTSRHSVEEAFAVPYLPVHFQLIKIWEDMLDVRPIGIKDNFFFLGGNSLLAARLVAHMDQVFGKKISLATLFTHPTIESLAKVLPGREDIQPATPLVAVQAQGTKRPFFYLHGDFKSGAFYCLSLARDLGNDQPLYVLEPPAVDGSRFPSSLEEMASMNIQFMRTIQPEGPYLIGGFCNGALIAYEMARQLHRQGEPIDLLLLIDPMSVGDDRWVKRMVNATGNMLHMSQRQQLYWFLWLRHAYKYLLHFYRLVKYPHYRGLQAELNTEQVNAEGSIVAALKSLFELQCGQGVKHERVHKQSVSDSKRGKSHAALLKIGSIFPDPLFPSFEKLSHDWEGLFLWSVADYVPDFYAGKSTFFFFEDGERRRKQWLKLAQAKDKEVGMYVLAGTHDTCKTDYLHDLTGQMRLCLDMAEEDAPGNLERQAL